MIERLSYRAVGRSGLWVSYKVYEAPNVTNVTRLSYHLQSIRAPFHFVHLYEVPPNVLNLINYMYISTLC